MIKPERQKIAFEKSNCALRRTVNQGVQGVVKQCAKIKEKNN